MSNGAGEHGCADWPKDSADFQAKPHSRIRLEPVFTGRLSFLTLRAVQREGQPSARSKLMHRVRTGLLQNVVGSQLLTL